MWDKVCLVKIVDQDSGGTLYCLFFTVQGPNLEQLLAQEFASQVYTFQCGTLGTVSFCPNRVQSSHFHG
jgi:hypothetical protein